MAPTAISSSTIARKAVRSLACTLAGTCAISRISRFLMITRSQPIGRRRWSTRARTRRGSSAVDGAERGARSGRTLTPHLGEKTPVSTRGDDLLRTAPDHPCLPQAQRVVPQRILRVIVAAPAARVDRPDRLQRVFVLGCVSLVHQKANRRLR